MPFLETVEDLAQHLLDKMGVYGGCPAHDTAEGCENKDPYCCRSGACMRLEERIIQAVENSKKLDLI